MPLPRPAPGTAKWWVIGTVGISLMTAMAIWWGLAASVDKASFQTTGYHVDGPNQVTVRWDVTRPVDRSTTCQVRALAQDYATVGSVDVVVPQGEPRTRPMTTVVRTTRLAVTGHVKVCSVPK